MPNLVGIGNSQAPTNSMLGGLAYQDSVGEINLDKIKAKTNDTAVDIFVYDTRKDSDGGAWRHRTQNKSWYNEGASEFRGARKEFPAVAVLVLSTTRLKIYDGDDPNLPMWMIFKCDNGFLIRVPHPSSVAMLNAKLVVGDHNNYAGSTIDFLLDGKDDERDLRQTEWHGNIANRNDSTYQGINHSRLATGQHTNDVAMIVLPNAPIDQATGLPIPTIAVATDDGFSVIKDTIPVTVADKQTTGAEAHQVAWLGPNRLVGTAPLYYGIFDDPLVHESSDLGYVSGGAESNYYYGPGNWKNTPSPIGNFSTTSKIITTDNKTIVATTTVGLNVHQISDSSIVDNNDGLVAYITSKYNSGWQVGDIKGAFLSDTVTEKDNVNYALTAEFDGTNRLSSQTYSNGKLAWQMVDNSGSNNGYVVIAFKGLTVGQNYKISMTWDNNATLDSGYAHRVVGQNGTANENNTNFDHWNKTNGSSETLTGVFTAQTTDNDDLVIYANAITLNVSDFKVEETDDVGEYGDGLGVGINGNLIKNPGPNFSNTNHWGATNGSLSVSSSDLLLTGANNVNEHMYSTAFTLISGKTYVLTVDSNQIFSYCRIGTDTGLSSAEQLDETVSQGLNSFTFTATGGFGAALFYLKLGMVTSYVTGSINWVSLRLAEEDRSVNGKGLEIYGQITKEPVAKGAELLSYSGINATNYLRQPYNPDLNFGTNDFSIFVWVKKNTLSTNHYIIDRGTTYPSWGGSSGRAYFIIRDTGHHRFKLAGGSEVSGTVKAMKGGNKWSHVGFVRKNGEMELWLNGELVQTVTGSNASASFDGGVTNQTTTINRYANGFAVDYTFDGMALLRISGTAPSSDQVRKMFNEERALFDEDAKCTLIGTSNAVNAIAHDDTTKILHVGTGSGRSDFRALSRINSTTEAVTAAISASDGLVAED